MSLTEKSDWPNRSHGYCRRVELRNHRADRCDHRAMRVLHRESLRFQNGVTGAFGLKNGTASRIEKFVALAVRPEPSVVPETQNRHRSPPPQTSPPEKLATS